MKKLHVSNDMCIGCGACIAMDPDHFDFSDEGFSVVKSNDNITDEIESVVECCPVGAIHLDEVAETEENEPAVEEATEESE
jgi:ferredoxin